MIYMQNISKHQKFTNSFDRFNELDHFEGALYGCYSKT